MATTCQVSDTDRHLNVLYRQPVRLSHRQTVIQQSVLKQHTVKDISMAVFMDLVPRPKSGISLRLQFGLDFKMLRRFSLNKWITLTDKLPEN